MTEKAASNYSMPFYSGPVVDGNGNTTPGFLRYQLALFNRTGKEGGMDAIYDRQQTALALNTANQAETDAQTAQALATKAEEAASQAVSQSEAAQKAAERAEADAQSALKAVEDVLIMTLLTSSGLTAKTAQSLDDAALMAAQSQIWPSLLLQSSRE